MIKKTYDGKFKTFNYHSGMIRGAENTLSFSYIGRRQTIIFMSLLGIFDFYHIENYGETSNNLFEVLITAILSGIVAWLAAKWQIENNKKHELQKDREHAIDSLSIIDQSANGVIKGMNAHISHLKTSFYRNGMHKNFDTPQLKLNESKFRYILNCEYTTLFKYLKILKVENDLSNKYLKAYTSIESFYQNYQDIYPFYNQKISEYNRIIGKIDSSMKEVATELNKLLYTDPRMSLINRFVSLDITERSLFRKENPSFEIYQELDNLAASYGKTRKRYIDSNFWLENLRIFCNKNAVAINLIDLAQAVLNAKSSIENLKTFYRSFNKSYKSYYYANKEYLKIFEERPDLALEVLKKRYKYQ